MPLSEHEQRLLDQIERALYADDPKFASAVRASDLKTHVRKRVRRAVLLLVVGLVALVVGAAADQWVVGVAGFVVMLAATLVLLRSLQRGRGRDGVASTRSPRRPGRTRERSGSGGGLLGRFEERWNRRWEDRDH